MQHKSIVTLICLFIVAATLVPTVAAQDGRRTRFGRKSRTAAIIAGGTGAGALIGGKKGALVGAGAGTLYSVNRGAARRNFKRRNRTIGNVAGGTLVGTGLGAAIGGGKGAAIGAIVGGGAGAGSVYVQGRDDLNLTRGTELTIRASAPR